MVLLLVGRLSEMDLSRKPNVVAVVVTWNKKAELLRCLDSVLTSTQPLKMIIVVDNASTDGTAEAVTKQFGPDYPLQLIINPKNLGGSGGFFEGIKAALAYQPDYLWLLDNDVILTPNTLAELLIAAEQDPRIGMVGSKVYFAQAPEIIWSIGARVNYWLALISVIGDKVKDEGQFNKILDVDYVPMCSLLVATKVIQAIGLVDPDYFVYGDDADFCTRAKKAGFRVVSAPKSIAWHDVTLNSSRLSPFAMYYYTRNYIHYFLKFTPIWYKPVITLWLLVFLMRRLLATVKYWPGWATFVQVEQATLAGFFDGWRGQRGKVY